MPHIAFFNASGEDLGFFMTDFVMAVDIQVNRQAGPVWNWDKFTFQIVNTVQEVPLGAWPAGWFKNADQAGAIAYHFLTPEGLPMLRSFTEQAREDGDGNASPMDHEVLETAGDPECDICVNVGPNRFWSREICDGPEAMSYKVKGIELSNFVYPAWFQKSVHWAPGTQFDYLKLCTQPLQILEGGYIDEWRPHTGWTQIDHMLGRKKKKLSNRQQKRRHLHTHGSLIVS